MSEYEKQNQNILFNLQRGFKLKRTINWSDFGLNYGYVEETILLEGLACAGWLQNFA